MRSRSKLHTIALLFAMVGLSATTGTGRAADPEETPAAIWIYKDTPKAGAKDARSKTEKMFAPHGFMPRERVDQIAVDVESPVDPKDPKAGTCIKYSFKFVDKDSDWQGVYTLVDGDAWGTKPGINIRELLKLTEDAEVVCRFRARGSGGEQVTFQCGGVTAGKHRSSLAFPVKLKPDPVKLTKEFQDFAITFKARELTNVVDPFCITATALDNPNKGSISVFVDDIRYEPSVAPKKLPTGWKDRLAQTLWICYTPTGFDPTAKPVKKPTAEDIRADLAAIRSLAKKAGMANDRVGIITYGCRDGLETIPALAKEAELSVILGVFNPTDETEVRNAAAILKSDDFKQTIAACCVGNEAITFRRATLDDVRRVATELRRVRLVPTTTTEIVQAYGEKDLFKPPFDFTLCNTHALFADIRDSEKGAKWAIERLKDLAAAAPKEHLILAKELGWPAGPAPFTAAHQAAYWKAAFADPVANRVNVCIFDAFRNVPWKKEMVAVGGKEVNVGPHWPVLFDEERKPTPFAAELLQLWKKSREE